MTFANRATHNRAVPAGTYAPVSDYVDKRYADTVVLTFREIEELLGFALPEAARSQEAWWLEALTVVRRSIKPNLAARIVAFERTS